MKAELILENGARFAGELFGDCREVVGEVVFSTGMVGYQEAITDPTYAGQIVAMTFPMLGNYGTNSVDMESEKAAMTAMVVREKCDFPSNFRSEKTLDEFMKEQGVVGLYGIDTRALTRMLRDNGTMKAAIAVGDISDEEARKRISALDNSDVIARVSTKSKYVYSDKGAKSVAVIDLGAKESLLREVAAKDCRVTVYPFDTKADEILADKPDVVLVSNGPGNPEDAAAAIETVRALIGKVPVSGICLGHLVVGLALGCKSEKLKFGHHGGNYPVKDKQTGKVYITSKNHNYVLTDLPEGVEETYVNVNYGTCEGIISSKNKAQSVQFRPEAAPDALGFIMNRLLGKED